MTTTNRVLLFAAGTLLFVLRAYCEPPNGNIPLRDDAPKIQGLRMGMQYQNSGPTVYQRGGTYLFSSVAYVFSKEGVSVYRIVSQNGDILHRESDNKLLTGDDSSVHGPLANAVGGFRKGAILSMNNDPSTQVEVIFGPGDYMPILENAPYKIEGNSVYVDWGQGHCVYFSLSGANSGSEVFSIKNDGLILESATSPGFILTLNMTAPPVQTMPAPIQRPIEADKAVLDAMSDDEREYTMTLNPQPTSGELQPVVGVAGFSSIRFVDFDAGKDSVQAIVKESLIQKTNSIHLAGEIDGGKLTLRGANSDTVMVFPLQQSYREVYAGRRGWMLV